MQRVGVYKWREGFAAASPVHTLSSRPAGVATEDIPAVSFDGFAGLDGPGAGQQACRTCCFWRPEKTVGDGIGWGQCRRMPPALPAARDDKLALVGIWPHTDGRDWCGEWQPTAALPAAQNPPVL